MGNHGPDDSEADTRSPRWSSESAERIDRTAENVAPAAEPPETDPAREVHLWDTWLLRNRYGEIASIGDWRLLFSLTAANDLLPGKRHDVAEIRYFYSKDGRNWELGGRVFDGGALGQRQWAGSAVYDDGNLYVFYTAAGDDGAAELTYSQRIVAAHGGSVRTSPDGVAVEGPWTHEVVLEPDGSYYETQEQSRGMIYTFRDPWLFEDRATGELYLLFEANVPVLEGSDRCDGDPRRQEFNGAVGIARSPTGDFVDWELLPPLLDAVCVNQELERPHVVVRDGRYYLFFSSHHHTFAPGFYGFDGLYGFVADSLRGAYQPLNDSALVVTNPANAPYQSYSWMVYPHSEDVLVQGFLNYYDFEGESLDAIADLPEREQRRRFGGTLGPTLRLALDGRRTRLRGALAHWHLPTPDEALPAPDEEWPPAGTRIRGGDESRDDRADRDAGYGRRWDVY